jgi:hypothetical protein
MTGEVAPVKVERCRSGGMAYVHRIWKWQELAQTMMLRPLAKAIRLKR